jgi:endoglucanase
LSVDVIRLPVDFNVSFGAPDYTIDPLLFKLMDKAVDWAEKYQIYIILDNHTLGQPAVKKDHLKFLAPVWTQMAEYYKNRSGYVIYEIKNEPNSISAGGWWKMQGDVIDAIRKIDQNHWIVVGGVEWNPFNTLFSLPRYTDNKLYILSIFTTSLYLPARARHGFQIHRLNQSRGFLSLCKSRMPIITSKMRWRICHSLGEYQAV